jgi:hypothetical protein
MVNKFLYNLTKNWMILTDNPLVKSEVSNSRMIREFEVDVYEHSTELNKKKASPLYRGDVIALFQKGGKSFFLVRTKEGLFTEASIDSCRAVPYDPSSKRYKRC